MLCSEKGLKRSAVGFGLHSHCCQRLGILCGAPPAACGGSTADFGYTFISSGGGAGGGERLSDAALSSTYLGYSLRLMRASYY